VRRGAVVRCADIPLSDRERVEGFHLTPISAVAVSFAATFTRSERGEGFDLPGSPAVAVWQNRASDHGAHAKVFPIL